MNNDQKKTRLNEEVNQIISTSLPAKSAKEIATDVDDVNQLSLISNFITTKEITTSAFIKLIKKKKTKKFDEDDKEKALLSLEEHDPNGERLWGLISQSSLPEALRGWVWIAAKRRLSAILGQNFNSHDMNATNILKNLCASLKLDIRSEDKNKSKTANNWLRICICWLIEEKSLDILHAAELISPIYFPDPKKVKRLVAKALGKGRDKELKLAVASVMLSGEIVKKAKVEQKREQHVSASLREKLTKAERDISALKSELEGVQKGLERKEIEFNNLSVQFDNERQHWSYDLATTKSKQQVFLRNQVTPLVADAVDALEIEPPAPHVALRRLARVKTIIEEDA
jgi:hypothetical protein